MMQSEWCMYLTFSGIGSVWGIIQHKVNWDFAFSFAQMSQQDLATFWFQDKSCWLTRPARECYQAERATEYIICAVESRFENI